jgi:ABC-2 type transport system permease protein
MQSMGELVAERFKNPAAMRPFLKQAQQELADAKDVPLILRPLLSQMLGSLDGLMESIEELQDAEADADVDTDSGPGFQIARIESIDVTRQYEKGSQGDLIRKLRSKWDISFPQAMQWGILACSAGFAVTLVRERTQGTMLRLQVAPVTRTQVFTGKAAACFFAVILVISGMVLLGVSLGMRPGNYPFLVIGGLCSAFCFVGVMMLMSVIGRSEESVSGAAWFANIMMAMFGGGMIPLAFMPDFMKTLSNFSPSKWSILAIEGAIWRGFSLGEMLLPCGVLLGIGAVCIAIGVNVLSRTDG